ncbi:MAG: hypothetical protein LBS55_12170 [Prevotellaceae bacterium]|nr:hypothetical protein [Prevotellaceae bacterium]
MKFPDVRNLVINTCQKNPAGNMGHKHELYEGSEKPQYTCKFCGRTFHSMRDMGVNLNCTQSPLGNRRHEPAL